MEMGPGRAAGSRRSQRGGLGDRVGRFPRDSQPLPIALVASLVGSPSVQDARLRGRRGTGTVPGGRVVRGPWSRGFKGLAD